MATINNINDLITAVKAAKNVSSIEAATKDISFTLSDFDKFNLHTATLQTILSFVGAAAESSDKSGNEKVDDIVNDIKNATTTEGLDTIIGKIGKINLENTEKDKLADAISVFLAKWENSTSTTKR